MLLLHTRRTLPSSSRKAPELAGFAGDPASPSAAPEARQRVDSHDIDLHCFFHESQVPLSALEPRRRRGDGLLHRDISYGNVVLCGGAGCFIDWHLAFPEQKSPFADRITGAPLFSSTACTYPTTRTVCWMTSNMCFSVGPRMAACRGSAPRRATWTFSSGGT